MDTTMEVKVDSAIGIFSIRVDMSDTVSTMKRKIENTQRIPVPQQTLYFNSKVLDDDLGIMQCKIFNNCRLLLAIAPEYSFNQKKKRVMVNDQVLTKESVEEFLMNDVPETMEGKNRELLHQTEKSLAEAIYSQDKLLSDISKIQTKEKIQDQYPTTTDPTKQSTSNTNHQDSTKKRKKIPLNVLSFLDPRKVPVDVNSDDKVGKLRERLADLYLLGKFALPEGEYFFINKQNVLIEDHTFEENRVAPFDTIQIICGKFPVRSSRSNKNDSLRSNSSQELRATQDLPSVPDGNKGINTEQSPKPVSVKRNIIIIPDSPERKRRKRVEFTVMVQPFKEDLDEEDARKIEVKVSPDEKVEELRAKLAKLKEKEALDLPEGYFFIHKQRVLTDHMTFEDNLVAPDDTVEIFSGSITSCD